MAEYKDVAAIKTKIQKICDNCWHPHRLGGCPEHCGINDTIKIIDSVPSVDAVTVVRCWECRYGSLQSNETGSYHCTQHNAMMRAHYYCILGERPQFQNTVYYCPKCGQMWKFKYNFCPNCGADMRKDGEHDTGRTEQAAY